MAESPALLPVHDAGGTVRQTNRDSTPDLAGTSTEGRLTMPKTSAKAKKKIVLASPIGDESAADLRRCQRCDKPVVTTLEIRRKIHRSGERPHYSFAGCAARD